LFALDEFSITFFLLRSVKNTFDKDFKNTKMKALYALAISTVLLFSSFTFLDGKFEDSLKNFDVKYSSELNAFVVKFPELTQYNGVMYQSEAGWQYKVFYKDIMFQQREYNPDSEEKLLFVSAKNAIDYMVKDIKIYNTILISFKD